MNGLLHEQDIIFDQEFDDAKLHTHVDDCVQIKFGTFAEVADTLIGDAVRFDTSAK